MESAQEYAQITELSRRVSEWEDKVLPRLQEEETHQPFDINTYGSSVIDNLDKGNMIKFQRLVQGKPVFEICRTFLASLMLVRVYFNFLKAFIIE
jgi:condensin-2 complex subunit H2